MDEIPQWLLLDPNNTAGQQGRDVSVSYFIAHELPPS
jgi:hypothetical protein